MAPSTCSTSSRRRRRAPWRRQTSCRRRWVGGIYHGDSLFFSIHFFCQLKNDLTLLTNPISSIAAVPAASAPGIGGGGVRRGGTEGTPTRGHPPPGHPPPGHPPPRHPPPGDSQASLQQLAESPRRVAECRAVLKAAVAVGEYWG